METGWKAADPFCKTPDNLIWKPVDFVYSMADHTECGFSPELILFYVVEMNMEYRIPHNKYNGLSTKFLYIFW